MKPTRRAQGRWAHSCAGHPNEHLRRMRRAPIPQCIENGPACVVICTVEGIRNAAAACPGNADDARRWRVGLEDEDDAGRVSWILIYQKRLAEGSNQISSDVATGYAIVVNVHADHVDSQVKTCGSRRRGVLPVSVAPWRGVLETPAQLPAWREVMRAAVFLETNVQKSNVSYLSSAKRMR